MESENVAVIGAGSWGTALAISLAKGGHHVSLWARREDAARLMSEERHNPTYLPDAIIPDSVHVTHDLAEAIHGATIWLIATPSQTVRQVAKDLDSYLTPDVVVISVAKGIENGTLLTTSCVLHDAFSDLPRDRIAVLYGPSHAEEVASECPTTVVAASTNRETAKRVQRTFMTCHLRVYVNHDTRGVEIAGSVKNVLAIAAGISDGVGFGDNAKAAILTRGLAEIKRLGVAMGADPSTFGGLAGIGDMVVTCMSTLSRNRNLGYELGKGKSLERVQSEMTMVAEGVRTTASVVELAKKYEVEMPITEAVYRILFENEPPREAVSTLMMRTAKQEAWTPIDTDD